jgi:GTPase SAR1 family protein
LFIGKAFSPSLCGAMGVCASRDEKTATDAALTKILAQNRKKERDVIRLLLVGAGESGKSTVLKQMKILNNEHSPFSPREISELKEICLSNTWKSFQQILTGCEELKIEYSKEETDGLARTILETEFMDTDGKLDFIRAHLLAVKADDCVDKVMERSHEIRLLDSAPYWLENLDRILAADFVPTQDDILRTRQATAGVIETDFEIDDTIFQFIDVGGQRGERRKWIHCFDQISAMFYVSALSGYSQVLDEDANQNRLRESLSLFRGLLGLPWFARTPVILFLNKDDVFRKKIQKLPLRDFFNEFTPNPDEDIYTESKDFVKDLFIFQARNVPQFNGTIFPHVTNATNTQNIESVWDDARAIVIKDSIHQSLDMRI